MNLKKSFKTISRSARVVSIRLGRFPKLITLKIIKMNGILQDDKILYIFTLKKKSIPSSNQQVKTSDYEKSDSFAMSRSSWSLLPSHFKIHKRCIQAT